VSDGTTAGLTKFLVRPAFLYFTDSGKMATMKINIKATNISLTPAITDYLNTKLAYLKKYLRGKEAEALADVEVGKISQHHRQGDVFRAEINISWKGELFRSEATKDDLYAAIDAAKDEIALEIKKKFKRQNSLIRRGARRLKNLFRRNT